MFYSSVPKISEPCVEVGLHVLNVGTSQNEIVQINLGR